MNFGVSSFFQCWAVIDFMKNLLILKDKLEWFFWIQFKIIKILVLFQFSITWTKIGGSLLVNL